MTDNKHPITPPPELVRKWVAKNYVDLPIEHVEVHLDDVKICTEAARWGADQELEACEKYWMTHGISPEGVVRMREARRPKPTSLVEQALTVLEQTMVLLMPVTGPEKIKQFETIRTALERLQALEKGSNGN